MFWLKKRDKGISKVDRNEEVKLSLLATANEVSDLSNDITEMLRNRIEDYSKQFETIAKAVPDSLLMIDETGVIVFRNDLANVLLGVDKDDNIFKFLRYGDYQITTIKDLRKAEEEFPETTLLSETVFLTNLAGTIILKPRISSFQTTTEEKRYVIILENVTSRVLDEQRFVSLHNYNRMVLQSIPDILVTISDVGIIKSVHNPLGNIIFDPKAIGEHYTVCESDNVKSFMTSILNMEACSQSFDFSMEIKEKTKYFNMRMVNCGETEMLVVIRDVTEMVTMQQNLDATNAHFLAFGKASSEAMFIHIDDSIVKWNANFSKMVGIEDFSQHRPIDFVHPIEKERYTSIASVDDDVKSYKLLLVNKSGDPIETTVQDNEIEWSNQTARIKVMRDVGELNNVEEVLKLSRERYKSIVDNTIDIVFCLNQKNEITFRNTTFNEYFGKADEGFLSVIELIDVRDRDRARSEMGAINYATPIARSLYRINRDGITRWIDTIMRGVFDNDSTVREIQVIARDVTGYVNRASTL